MKCEREADNIQKFSTSWFPTDDRSIESSSIKIEETADTNDYELDDYELDVIKPTDESLAVEKVDYSDPQPLPAVKIPKS